jgi:hypothetical protein
MPAFSADLAQQGSAQVQAPAPTVIDWNITKEFRFYTFNSSRGTPAGTAGFVAGAVNGSGSQLYIPVSLSAGYNSSPDMRYDFLVRSGYVYSRQTTAGFSGSLGTATDTSITGTATYSGFAEFQPFVSVTVNAPTGRSALFGDAVKARMDPDLVELAGFGEGWNVGPTVGINLPINQEWVASIGGGATFRGSYDRETDIGLGFGFLPTQRYSPSDVFTANASLAYSSGPLTVVGSFAISAENSNRLNGVELFEAGNRYVVGLNGTYVEDDNWSTTVSGTFIHADRNRLQNIPLPPALVLEILNSNNNVYRLQVDQTYRQDNWSLGPTASILYRDRNAFNSITAQFVPAKTRVSFGAVGAYAVNNDLSFTARLEHVWTDEDNKPDFQDITGAFIPGSGVPSIASDGWAVSFGGSLRF